MNLGGKQSATKLVLLWSLGLVAVLLLTPRFSASAQGLFDPSIEIMPPNPNDRNNITVHASGEWPNGCVPHNPQVSILLDQIFIDMLTAPRDAFCTAVVGSWDEQVLIGQLPAGSYSVVLTDCFGITSSLLCRLRGQVIGEKVFEVVRCEDPEGTGVPCAFADLSLTQSDDPDPVTAGQTLTYTITVSNAGPDAADHVVVTDTLPSGVTLESTRGCSEDPNAVPACRLGSIAAGASAQYTVKTTVHAGATGTLANRVAVAANIVDPDTSNNVFTENTTVRRPLVCGDQNNDGEVDVRDAIIGLRIIAGSIEPTDEQKLLLDVTGPRGIPDGRTDIFDVMVILEHVVETSEITECGFSGVEVQPGQNFRLKIGEAAFVKSERLRFRFLEVSEDSRCPLDVVCVWEGQATAVVGLAVEGEDPVEISLTLRAGHDQLATEEVGEYAVTLVRLDPYPISTRPTQPADYLATFLISLISDP